MDRLYWRSPPPRPVSARPRLTFATFVRRGRTSDVGRGASRREPLTRLLRYAMISLHWGDWAIARRVRLRSVRCVRRAEVRGMAQTRLGLARADLRRRALEAPVGGRPSGGSVVWLECATNAIRLHPSGLVDGARVSRTRVRCRTSRGSCSCFNSRVRIGCDNSLRPLGRHPARFPHIGEWFCRCGVELAAAGVELEVT
jgi:hypothetical protein